MALNRPFLSQSWGKRKQQVTDTRSRRGKNAVLKESGVILPVGASDQTCCEERQCDTSFARAKGRISTLPLRVSKVISQKQNHSRKFPAIVSPPSHPPVPERPLPVSQLLEKSVADTTQVLETKLLKSEGTTRRLATILKCAKQSPFTQGGSVA